MNVQGEVQQKLDVLANEYFLRACEWGGQVAGMVSEEIDDPPYPPLPIQYPRGKYLLIFDPLDGSSNIDVNVSVGSIFFSILRAPNPGADPPSLEDFLQPGTEQVCAGVRDLRPVHHAGADRRDRCVRVHPRSRFG